MNYWIPKDEDYLMAGHVENDLQYDIKIKHWIDERVHEQKKPGEYIQGAQCNLCRWC